MALNIDTLYVYAGATGSFNNSSNYYNYYYNVDKKRNNSADGDGNDCANNNDKVWTVGIADENNDGDDFDNDSGVK